MYKRTKGIYVALDEYCFVHAKRNFTFEAYGLRMSRVCKANRNSFFTLHLHEEVFNCIEKSPLTA